MVSCDALQQCITSRTRVIIPVHFAGAAADMGPIRKLADERGIFLLEDSAHALGTHYIGEHVGRKGTSIFSFHPIKNITTGEGGMFCSSDEGLLGRIRQLKFHGLGVDAYDRQTQGRSPQAEVLEPGYKYNMTDISAALGISQLGRVEQFNARRAELAARYTERLAEVEEILPLRVPAYPMKHAWHLYIVRLDTDKARLSRDDFMRELKQRNIGTGLHFRAVHLQKYYREAMGMRRWIYSCCKQLLDRVIWAYGQKEGLKFTLFRPFNWIGPKLDSLTSARIGSSRAITQLILNLVEGTPIQLIDGGSQQRCFTDVRDGVECLFRIIENKDNVCDGKIINIGNPDNQISIRGLAELLLNRFEQHPLRPKFPPFAGFRMVES